MIDQARDRVIFDVLNGLRGIAAIAVVNAHLAIYFAGYGSPSVGLAVDFFMLSGFVVAHAYQDRMAAGFGTGRFIDARLRRALNRRLLGRPTGGHPSGFSAAEQAAALQR